MLSNKEYKSLADKAADKYNGRTTITVDELCRMEGKDSKNTFVNCGGLVLFPNETIDLTKHNWIWMSAHPGG